MKVMNIHIAILHLTNLQELLVNYETLFEEVCECLPLEIIRFSQIFSLYVQHAPFEVISSESDDESQRIADVQHSYCSNPLNIEPESSLELNADDAYNAVDQHQILNNDVDLEIMVDNPLNTSQTELTDHGSLQLENNTDGKNENYCLTELQPATNESLQNIISTSVDENLKSYSTMCTDPEALSNDNEEVLLSDEDEQSIDQKQCLKLNRQYQVHRKIA